MENQVFETKRCGLVRVTKYRTSASVDVQFIETGHAVTTRKGHILIGNISDPYAKKFCDIGYIGVGSYKAKLNGKSTKAYNAWSNMIKRCYSPGQWVTHPTYEPCFVAGVWHNFQNFAKWYDDNYVDGCDIDKDILYLDNKYYSPDTCAFIPSSFNKQISATAKGVYKTATNKWQSSILINGKCSYLGNFDTEDEARDAYVLAKAKFFKSCLDDINISERVKAAINARIERILV